MSLSMLRSPSSVFCPPSSGLQHSECMHVGLEDRFVLAPLVGILPAETHDRAQGLEVEAVGLGFRIDVADIARDCLLLLFQPLDALDEGFQVVLGKASGALLLLCGSGSGHSTPPPATRAGLFRDRRFYERRGQDGTRFIPGVHRLVGAGHEKTRSVFWGARASARLRASRRAMPRPYDGQ